jgi:hypothetical protein
MSEPVAIGGHGRGFGSTTRVDAWWVGPAVTATILILFMFVYAPWAGMQGDHYFALNYLSPLFSPVIWTDLTRAGAAPLEHAWLGVFPESWPSWLAFLKSPAVIILPIPVSFRATCYYYRKAYYRAFFGTPPGCAVGPAPQIGRYEGETFLLIIQNLHRYSLYLALLYLPILGYDAVISYSYEGKLGIGVGSIVLTVNALLLAGYTFGCHSFRHLVGGKLNCFSCDGGSTEEVSAAGRWRFATWFNQRHMQFAWASLFWVMGTDFYVRAVSHGWISDLNTWGVSGMAAAVGAP